MAINFAERYPGQAEAPSSAFPYGAPRDVVSDGDGTGTPAEAAWVKDFVGFLQALLVAGDVVASGDHDTAETSQYFEALGNAMADFNVKATDTEDSRSQGDWAAHALNGDASEQTTKSMGATVHLSNSFRNGRQLSLEDFSAKGDDSYDNTSAIEDAIGAMLDRPLSRDRVLRVSGGEYLFDQINIPIEGTGITLVGDAYWSSNLKCMDSSSAPAIACAAQEFKMIQMGLNSTELTENNRAVGKPGIRLDKGVGQTADIDAYFNECRISEWNEAIICKGRGLTIRGGFMTVNKHPVSLDWYDPSDYAEGEESAQKDLTGFRTLDMSGVRLHSNIGAAVLNTGSNAHKLNSMRIIGCKADVGRALFEGDLGIDAMILGNQCVQNPDPALIITGGERFLVSGNILSGDDKEGRISENIIHLTGTLKDGVFSNSVISACTQHAINDQCTTLDGVQFTGLTFNDVCTDGGAYKPIAHNSQNGHITHRNIQYNGTLDLAAVIDNNFSNNTFDIKDVRAPKSSTPAVVGNNIYADGEESAWVPVLSDAETGGNVSSTTADYAFYVKEGKQVTLYAGFTDVDTAGMTPGGDLYIQGVPIVSKEVSGNIFYTGTIGASDIDFSGQLAPAIRDGKKVIRLQETIPDVQYDYTLLSEVDTGVADFYINITYPID